MNTLDVTTMSKLPSGVTDQQSGRDLSTSWFKRCCKDVFPIHSRVGDDLSKLSQTGANKSAAVFIAQDHLWNGTPQNLKYFFIEGTDEQKQKVREVSEVWTWYANIEFNEVQSANDSDIRIKFDSNDGSWSYVGRQCTRIDLQEPTMNLAWLDKSLPITATEKSVILHEFGHVLGLLHEHQSPASGGVPLGNVEACVELFEKTQNWSRQQTLDRVINPYNKADVSNYSQVDRASIMHYPLPSAITGMERDIPFNSELSPCDKAFMILQYPREPLHPHAQAEGWIFEKALLELKAPEDLVTRILQLLKSDRDQSGEINPSNIRNALEQWTRERFRNSTAAKTGVAPNPADVKLDFPTSHPPSSLQARPAGSVAEMESTILSQAPDTGFVGEDTPEDLVPNENGTGYSKQFFADFGENLGGAGKNDDDKGKTNEEHEPVKAEPGPTPTGT